MSIFVLPKADMRESNVMVTLVDGLSQEELLAFPAFRNWLKALRSSLSLQRRLEHPFHENQYTLRSIQIQAVDRFGPRIGFIKMMTEVSNERGDRLPGGIFLRGGSVAVLMILSPTDAKNEKWVIMTSQPRIPAGSLDFFEIPAGMIDDSGTFRGAAAKEILEETTFEIPEDQLVDMTKMALMSTTEPEQHLQKAMYPSPGGCDEFIPIFLWQKLMERDHIEELKGKLTGIRSRGEMITLKLVKYEELWRQGARDAKTLAAWALYEGLVRDGKI